MLRKLSAVLAALVVMTGLGFAVTSGADAKSVLPAGGAYAGVDHGGRMITFSFSGNTMTHFTVNHTVIGGAHVGGGAWHETCHNGMCTKGMWVTDHHVTGSWRSASGGAWVHFNVYYKPGSTIPPYTGAYLGQDRSGLRVHLTFRDGTIHGFSLNHSARGNIAVRGSTFETCLPSICVKGHWQSEYEVIGSWRPVNSSTWVPWDAYAYAS
jgi:hypothetical protein